MSLCRWLGDRRSRSQMMLTEYKYDHEKEYSRSVYLLRHTSAVSKMMLEQFLTVERDSSGRFIPSIALDDFPKRLSEREAMLKLADWLHRLSVVIEDNWSTH